jgi:hypothetical protein
VVVDKEETMEALTIAALAWWAVATLAILLIEWICAWIG